MKAHEIYATIDPALVSEMLGWFRAHDRNIYRTAVNSLTANRKLRPVFIEKKPLAEQYAWILKTLQLRTCDEIGEQLIQAYLMAGQQPMLASFCDGLRIPHDGKGVVTGALPDQLDADQLATTIDTLIESHDPKLVTLYLLCFNMQIPNGWPTLTEKLANDPRLKLA
jgi:hypothetical protein